MSTTVPTRPVRSICCSASEELKAFHPAEERQLLFLARRGYQWLTLINHVDAEGQTMNDSLDHDNTTEPAMHKIEYIKRNAE